MSPTNEGSNDTGISTKKEPGRRCWIADHEVVLLDAIKHLVIKGWKSDNGFRGGYVKHLEVAMKKAFPMANYKGDPHINSKITAWMKDYASLVTILNCSGVGFNLKGDHKIDCDDESWKEIMKTEKNWKKMKERSWPLLEGWREVFGKDRASGEGAKDVMESVNELITEHEVKGTTGRQTAENIIDLDENMQAETEQESVGQSTGGGVKAKPSSSKKRKAQDNIDRLCELLENIHKDTNARLQDLTHKLGYQADIGKMRNEVFSLLQMRPDLSLDDQLCACEKLVAHNSVLEMFMSLPPIARAAYVQKLL